MRYIGELRTSADTTSAERDVRGNEVMAELGLTKHANTRADRLSGGRLKRVNVAQELLTKLSLWSRSSSSDVTARTGSRGISGP